MENLSLNYVSLVSLGYFLLVLITILAGITWMMAKPGPKSFFLSFCVFAVAVMALEYQPSYSTHQFKTANAEYKIDGLFGDDELIQYEQELGNDLFNRPRLFKVSKLEQLSVVEKTGEIKKINKYKAIALLKCDGTKTYKSCIDKFKINEDKIVYSGELIPLVVMN